MKYDFLLIDSDLNKCENNTQRRLNISILNVPLVNSTYLYHRINSMD